jgi:lipoprotein-anchoring transpeptidase ErfK/SrfK
MRKIKWWVWVVVVIVALGSGGGAYVWTESAHAVTMGTISPAADSRFATRSVTITFPLVNYQPGRGRVTVLLDGRTVPASEIVANGQEMKVEVVAEDGTHDVVVGYTSSNPFSRELNASTSFSIDSTAPVIQVVSPQATGILTDAHARVEAESSEPVASATLIVNGSAIPLVTAGQELTADVTLQTGTNDFRLTVGDDLGNTATAGWQVQADVGAPVVVVSAWPGPTWKKNSGSLSFTAADAFSEGMSFAATLDGQPIAAPQSPAAAQASPASQTSSAAMTSVTRSPAGPATVGYSVDTGKLTEGRHEVEVTVANIGGRTDSWSGSFVVDSTEELGAAVLGPGAIGKDVKTLQQVLKQRKLYTGELTSEFDTATQQAVLAYKTAHNLGSTPTVDKTIVSDLKGLIKVDRGKRKLYLYQDGGLVKTYGVAVGQPAYPTPVGNWVILRKEVNPTWYPPNSPWAKGAKPIGPGPNCPLQARAMWLDAPAIGIHGTNAPSSIGSAASHGCIRMRAADVIDLYSRVFVGTPVQIVD